LSVSVVKGMSCLAEFGGPSAEKKRKKRKKGRRDFVICLFSSAPKANLDGADVVVVATDSKKERHKRKRGGGKEGFHFVCR